MEKYLVISERQEDLPRGLNFYCSSHLILHNSFPGVVPNFFEKERIFFILKPANFFLFIYLFSMSDVILLLTHMVLRRNSNMISDPIKLKIYV